MRAFTEISLWLIEAIGQADGRHPRRAAKARGGRQMKGESPMTMTEIKNQITALGREIKQDAAALAAMANDTSKPIADVERAQQALAEKQGRMNALRAAWAVENDKETGVLVQIGDTEQEEKRTRASILKSKEYARAFAYAMTNGITRKTGRGNERCNILFDALTIGGGEPVGADGGFLVPEDLDYQIRERRRTLQPLADLFSHEMVTAPTGWRVVDTQPTKGFTKIDGEMKNVPQDDQPAFERVGYTTDKYGLILPVSNELNADSVTNLFAYLANWAAKKQVITENSLLISALQELNATELNLTATPLQGIKTMFNVDLDPVFSDLGQVLVNQTSFNTLDMLEDKNGRGLLTPDPTNATINRLLGRNVRRMSNATLQGNDLYAGLFSEYATLFTRQNMEMAATDVGGNAWSTDSTEYRFITRMGVTVFDDEAVVRRTLTAGA